MDEVKAAFRRAVDAHRAAVAHARRADEALRGLVEAGTRATDTSALSGLARQLDDVATVLLPGWLGVPLDGSSELPPTGRDAGTDRPVALRIGDAVPGDGTRFPALVPFLGAGHLAVDADARDPLVAGLLRSVLTRLLAGCAPGSLQILPVDGATMGATFTPFQPLVAAGAMARPATDTDSLAQVLDAAERHVHEVRGGATDAPYLLVVVASLPPQAARSALARLTALTHAGARSRTHLILCGYRSDGGVEPPPVDDTCLVTLDGDTAHISDPSGGRYGVTVLNAPVRLDPGPSDEVLGHVCRQLAAVHRAAETVRFADLMPATPWSDSSVDGLRTAVGRDGRRSVELALDDRTPHWLVGGRTGSGKTVFLLDVLYGLAARYSPDELALYLLDFKEGISFTEFTPTAADPTWIPHARAVGIESDREYGVAVLRELVEEMGRRSRMLKRAGVVTLADLRRQDPDVAMPRIVTVVDEFHVLFAGNDRLAHEAAGLLEDLARKGRAYGVHLVLSSQTASGVEALYNKSDSIFGQFPLRVALAGGNAVLHPLNTSADGLPVGSGVVNDAGGVAGHDRTVRFPDAHADRDVLAETRQRMWHRRRPGSPPPAVFQGFADQRVDDDSTYRSLTPAARRRSLLVGRRVDVTSSTAQFGLDDTPGRHLAVLGSHLSGADVLHAAAVGLSRQHDPATARFVVASLVEAGQEAAADVCERLTAVGHRTDVVDANGLRAELAALTATTSGPVVAPGGNPERTYVVVFGMDGAASAPGGGTGSRSGRPDLQHVLAEGPAHGVHVLGWWRGVQRFSDDVGGSRMRENVTCLVALNVPAQALGSHIGAPTLQWQFRPDRALMLDLRDDERSLIVPFARAKRSDGKRSDGGKGAA